MEQALEKLCKRNSTHTYKYVPETARPSQFAHKAHTYIHSTTGFMRWIQTDSKEVTSALNTILSKLVAIFDALQECCVDIARRLKHV
jgi:hypothetical protein